MQNLTAGRQRWRQTDATMDVESLGEISVSSSVERQAMREQLDAVRQTLNTLASGAQPSSSGIAAASVVGGLESVLSDIASKLSSIEGLYTNLTSKLEKVDLRVEDSERHIKDLQHFSASTIHETARLVDYVGGRATPNTRAGSLAGAGPAGTSTTTSLRARHMAAAAGVPSTPPPATVSPVRTPMAALEYVPGHMTATIQQHAAQIHKLIAGLDFLEAHIIRQDQVVDGLQKSMTTVVASQPAALETRSPSELSLRLHDMAETLTKLKAHMYKVEKKSGAAEQALASLTERMQAVELAAAGAASAAERRSDGGSEAGSRDGAGGPSTAELAAAQEDLRSLVLGLGRDVEQLRDQVQAPPPPPPFSVSADEGAEMRRQLTYLMSQVPTLVMENTELRHFATRTSQQLAELSQQQQQQQQASEATGSAAPAQQQQEAAVQQLGAAVAALRDQVAGLEARVGSLAPRGDLHRVSAAAEAAAASSASAASSVEELGATVAALEERVAGLGGRVDSLDNVAAGLSERVEGLDQRVEEQLAAVTVSATEAAAAAVEVNGEVDGDDASAASASREEEGVEQGREVRVVTAVAVLDVGVAKAEAVGPVPVDDPAAAMLAAKVAAAARANLEEQFGQLRHRLEMAAESAAAAEEAARRSAESAAAAVTAAEEAAAAATDHRDVAREFGASSSKALAELQESVLVMMASVEQEQAVLKQQAALVAAQVSEDQAGISSGLLQVRQQVEGAVAAAAEAVTCAQQAAAAQQEASERQERQAAEALQGVQAELQQRVAGVMEALKERVEGAMQRMGQEVTALSDQVASSVQPDQLEAALQDIRAAAVDATERYDMDQATLEELRSEMILLTGQQDVVLSRLGALEAAVGVDPRVSAPGGSLAALVAVAAAAPELEGDGDGNGAVGSQGGAGSEEGAGDGEEAAARVSTSRAAISGGCGGGLLELVAQLRSWVGGLEGALDAAAADMEQVRGQLQWSAQEAEGKIRQATAQLAANLEGLSAAVEGLDGRVADTAAGCEALSAAVQRQGAEQAEATGQLASRLEELQARLEAEVIARVQETSAAVSSLSARLARDYVNREQLGAIFQARADMKRAVDELATVFDTGRLMRSASGDAPAAGEGPSPSGGSGTLSPRLFSALEDLAGKQAELEHQVKLALYRTEGAVRQEELRGLQQAMMTLELQFRKMGTPAATAPAAAAPVAEARAISATTTEVSGLRTRVEALEVALAAHAVAATPTTAAGHNACDGDFGAGEQGAGVTQAAAGADTDDSVHLELTPDNSADSSSPVRVRLLVGLLHPHEDAAAEEGDDGQADSPDTPDGGGGPVEEAAAEPSLSQMLLHLPGIAPELAAVGASTSSSPPDAGDEAQLQALHRTVHELVALGEALRSELAAAVEENHRLAEALAAEAAARAALGEALAGEVAEQHRLAEALADLQERLDSQVNVTASTAAMLATMATDQHQRQQQVRLTLRVGGPEAEDFASLADQVSTLTARLDTAEEALSSAFVVRTPRSPSRPTAAAAAAAAAAFGAAADGPEAAEDGVAVQDTADRAAVSADTEEGGQEGLGAVVDHDQPEEEEDEDGEDVLRPALGLMVPVVPREMEQQLAALAAEVSALSAAVGAMGGRVEALEAADALEDVRAAASQVVLEAIPGMVSQQVGLLREEIAGLVAQQGEPLVEMAGQAARDAAEAVLAVREAAAEAVAAREAVVEVQAAAEAAAEAVRRAIEVAEVARGTAEEAARKAGEAATAAQAAAAEAGECRLAAAAAAEQAAEGVREAGEAIREAAAQAAARNAKEAAVAAAASESAAEVEATAAATAAAPEEADMSVRDLALAAAREAALEVAASVAREVVAEAAAGTAAAVRDVRAAVSSLGQRVNDGEAMRDQLESLTAQVRDIMDAPAGIPSAPSSQPPSTPTAAAVASIFTPAATALVMQPAATPRTGPGASPRSASGAGARPPPPATSAQTTGQQAAFLARMVAAVKGYSNRMHTQYSDAEETGMALSQVDSSLEEVSARFADLRDPSSPAFAEALVMILEQVAALRYIGSQTHPAIQQMVLEHENRLDLLTDQIKAIGSRDNGDGAGGTAGAGGSGSDPTVAGRLAQLEAELGRIAGHQTALDQAVSDILATAATLREQAATPSVSEPPPRADDGTEAASEDGAAAFETRAAATAAVSPLELAALSAKVRLLDDSVSSRLAALREELGASGGLAHVEALADLGGKVASLHSAWTNMRNRVLAVQEYTDNTQSMIKDTHVALGGLHRRIDALEGSLGLTGGAGGASGRVSTRVSGSGGSVVGGSEPGGMRELQSEVSRLETRLLSLESSSIEAAHALALLKGLPMRVTEAETRLADASTKLAAALGGTAASGTVPVIPAPGPGVTLPGVAGGLRALERRLSGRLEAAFLALDSLSAALSAAGKIQAESTANPFKAISAAVKNPVVVALEEKLESMRATVETAVLNVLEDLRRDQQQQQFESRLGAATEGGSTREGSYGTPGGSISLRL